MTPRSIRRAAERRANKLTRKAEKLNGPSAAVSEAQFAANRENARLSTGPITEAGKAKSSLNAIKTGLTGRAVLLPTDDAARYEAHLQSYEDHFQPVGAEEQSLVQSLADTAWRLARVPGLEMAIYAKGRIEFAEEFKDQDESARPALIEAQTYVAYEKQIRNLNLQEARLVRRREKETAELRSLQQQRKAKETCQPKAAARPIHKPVASQSLPEIGFDFSNDYPSTEMQQSDELLFANRPQIPAAA